MARFFSPRAASILFVLAIMASWFSSVWAQTPGQVEFATFQALYKWMIGIAVAVVFLQAFLIFRLLITQRRRRQAEIESHRLELLARSDQKRLEEVVSDVPGIVWESRLDPDTGKWTATFISDYAETMTGYKIEEWLSIPGLGQQIVHEEDRERVTDEIAAVFSGAERKGIQFRWIAKNQSIVWAEAHLAPLVDETGAAIGVRGVTLDITEQHAAEEARRHSEEKFAKAFRANPQPMSLCTVADGRYVDVNESFLQMSGYTREEVIGRTSFELGVWETIQDRNEFVGRLKREGSIVNFETRFRTKAGSIRVLLASAETLELSGEECLLFSSSDITERVAAQQALQESEERFSNMADLAPIMIWITVS